MAVTENVRNFTVVGHSGSGKTSLCDLILHKSGAVDRRGSVDQKNSVSDYTSDEQERVSSIYATSLQCDWNGTGLFFTDTPGYGEFIGEMTAALSSCDNSLIVIDGVNGLEVGTVRAWQLSKKLGRPRFIFVNRLDKEMADFGKVLSQIQEAYGKTVCVPFTMPVGKESGFESVVNVLQGEGAPDDIKADADAYREQLMDAIAESDEELMMKYLEGETLTDEEIAKGLHTSIMSGDLVPVFAGSAEKDVGVEELMNAIVNLFPSPTSFEKLTLNDDKEIPIEKSGPGLAQVFKSISDPFIGQLTFFRVLTGEIASDTEVYNTSNGTKERFGTIVVMNGKNQTNAAKLGPGCIGAIPKLKSTGVGDTLSAANDGRVLPPIVFPNPVMSYAVSAVKSGEEEKIASGLRRLAESDPVINVERNNETAQLLLSGMGDQHLAITVNKLKQNNKVDVELTSPKIPYRETITASGEGHYRHKKQSGGHGQFGEVFLRVAPNEEGYEFANEVVGGNIPKNFIPAVEKGVVEAMVKGPLAGCLVEKVKVTVYDGKHHPVDSSEMSFKIASRMAFRDAMSKAKPILLEPVMTVSITIPDEYMGDISGDLNQKRGRILGMSVEEGMQVVKAEVPLAEMSRYASELRSMTQGRGLFEMEFNRYEMVPANVAKDVIDQAKRDQDEEE